MATASLGALLDGTFARLIALRPRFNRPDNTAVDAVYSALHELLKPALPEHIRDLPVAFELESGDENPPAAVLCELNKLDAILAVMEANKRRDEATNLRAAVAEIRQALQGSSNHG